MSVIFHIATQQHWERASRAGVYTTVSLREDGFIHCATATQHATVANKLFAGRADLVLLLIDADRPYRACSRRSIGPCWARSSPRLAHRTSA